MTSLTRLIAPVFFFLLLVVPFTGCDVAKQARQVSALASCDFRILSVEDINLAGVAFEHVQSVSDLAMSDVAMILAGFASPTFPLSLQINLEVRNPNAKEAGLNRLEWIVFIDEIQMTSGFIDKPVSIPARTTSIVPVPDALDLKQVLSGKSATTMLNFCMNLAGVGNMPTRFKIKLKPSVIVAGSALTYPGFITVNTTYTSK
jgi:hypothetical protein